MWPRKKSSKPELGFGTEVVRSLATALDRGKATWVRVQDRAVEGAKVTDHAIRTHPYQALGVAFGVGAVLGLLLSRRN